MGAVTRLAWLLAAGLPTSGTFVALLLLLPALTPRHPWLAVVTGLATAALILAALRWEPPGAGLPVPDGRRSWRLLAGAASPLALLLFIGIYPAPVLDVLRAIRSLEAHRVSGSSSDSSSGVPDADSLSTAAADTTAAGRREVDGL